METKAGKAYYRNYLHTIDGKNYITSYPVDPWIAFLDEDDEDDLQQLIDIHGEYELEYLEEVYGLDTMDVINAHEHSVQFLGVSIEFIDEGVTKILDLRRDGFIHLITKDSEGK